MDTISEVKARPSRNGTSVPALLGLLVFALLLWVLLVYYVKSPPIPLLVFSLLSVWTAWKDLCGYVVRDSVLATVFSLLAFFCYNGNVMEFLFSFFLLFSMSTLADALSTRYVKEDGKTVRTVYYGSAGYLVGWMEAVFLSLLAYALFPVERALLFHTVSGGWEFFFSVSWLPTLVAICLFFLTSFFYRKRIKDTERRIRWDGAGWVRLSNMRPQTTWFVASFGALIGFPASVGVLLLSFLLFLPFYLRPAKRMEAGAEAFHEAESVRFPFLAHLKKGT